MFGNWYVVANQRRSRIFVEIPNRKELRLLETLINPLGKEKKSSLIRKEFGEGMKSIGHKGGYRHARVLKHDPLEEAALQFAKQINNYLTDAKKRKRFEQLTVVAEPHFLGKIRSRMKPTILKTVNKWIKSDLNKVPLKDISKALMEGADAF